jgi:phytoene synthase
MTSPLDHSYEHCREVARTRARNFFYGMKLTPEPKRSAMYAIYAWMRQADDLADEAGGVEEKTRRLEAFSRQTDAVIRGDAAADDHPLWPALRQTVVDYRIPAVYLHAMIDGQLLDMRVRRYDTFDRLYDYCYKVASVVGLTCIEVWGYEGGEQTRQLAEWRGIAFQLTNILRDVREDARRDRVYLPAEALGVHEVNPTMFQFGVQPEAVDGVRRIAERAAAYYERSARLEAQVHPDGRPCLWAMTAIYRGILGKIRRRPACVLAGERVRLSGPAKSWIALRAKWKAAAR